MIKRKIKLLKISLFVTILIAFESCAPKQETIVVNPVETDITLLNPGRGFTTTGGRMNESIGERLHPMSGVHQMRWNWDFIEPEEGEINFSLIDSLLEQSAKNEEQLNFRIMCQDVEMKIPEWAIKAGIKGPDYYNDPVFLEKQGNLIKALGKRYDGHPNLVFMDIGTVGQWGEWHSEEKPEIKMPSMENAKKIVDMYLNSFKKTPLVMLINGVSLEYAIENGAGWRADCWGDYGDEWKHMEVRYPTIFKKTKNSMEAWKNGPIALETCWTIDYWFDQGWDIDKTLAKSLEWHTTSVNNGTYTIPEKWWDKIVEFEKKLGYRFALNQLTYPSSIKAGKELLFTMEWENKGVAPIYRAYPLAFKLVSRNTNESWLIITNEDISKWMPGVSILDASIILSESMESGEYELQIGIIEEQTEQPVIKLAIEGINAEGWYPMGNLNITK